jgi:hypothetical protein
MPLVPAASVAWPSSASSATQCFFSPCGGEWERVQEREFKRESSREFKRVPERGRERGREGEGEREKERGLLRPVPQHGDTRVAEVHHKKVNHPLHTCIHLLV